MFTDQERDAVARWYSQPHVLEQARTFFEDGAYDDLEEFLHKICLMPLGRHADLPDYMRDEGGKPLFKDSLSPLENEEQWQDAIEVGWEVVRDRLGFSQDDVHKAIATHQQDDWQAFLDSVERRRRERGKTE